MNLDEQKEKSTVVTIAPHNRSGSVSTPTLDELQKLDRSASRSSLWLRIWTLLSSPVTQALLLLLGVNVVFSIAQPFSKVDPLLLPATHTWAWWATQEYIGERVTPPVVLAGSSLFMHPVSRQDADYLGQDIDYVHHHYSSYLEALLHKRFGASANTFSFNFSLPGSLVSDDYMIVRALFHGEQKPKCVILGLSLRDFIDNAVNCPGTTPPFRYFKRFGQMDDLIDLSCPMFWQQFDYRFGQFFYLWGRKLDLQVLLDQKTKDWLRPVMRNISSPSLLNNLDYRKHVPLNLHSEVEEGMAIVRAHQPYSFDLNLADYQRRCGNPKPKMFDIQTTFLNKLIDLCKLEKIRLVIINMPLTKENLAIMPRGSYEHYVQTLKDVSKGKGVAFVDFNGDPRFLKSDFYDSAHMNASGGKKLLQALSKLDCISL